MLFSIKGNAFQTFIKQPNALPILNNDGALRLDVDLRGCSITYLGMKLIQFAYDYVPTTLRFVSPWCAVFATQLMLSRS